MDNIKLDLLEKNDVCVSFIRRNVLKKYGSSFSVTDLAILTGGYVNSVFMVHGNNSLFDRSGWIWTKTVNKNFLNYPIIMNPSGDSYTHTDCLQRYAQTILPELKLSTSLDDFLKDKNIILEYNVEEVEYGEYPQWAPDEIMQERLDKELKNGNLKTTGKIFTFNCADIKDYDAPSFYLDHKEYVFEGKKYIRIKPNFNLRSNVLSNGVEIDRFSLSYDKYVWVEVSPVTWLIDRENNSLISKRALLSGIRFDNKKEYDGKFENTEMYRFLNNYMRRDLFNSIYKDFSLNRSNDLSSDKLDMLKGIINDIAPEDREAYLKALNELNGKASTRK